MYILYDKNKNLQPKMNYTLDNFKYNKRKLKPKELIKEE